ncbi:MAG: thiamine pyrophosphate-dependent enzyme [Planctomycetota bacterium]|nr:thiamine pyrophosphate-dependent enzyme [Planctomycetota bacterium]MDA1212964.1 thiamine pyrophosphate-dependent enzyme [Planctomycetota bacterium]
MINDSKGRKTPVAHAADSADASPVKRSAKVMPSRDQLSCHLYHWMSLAREIDRVEQELVQQGKAFFHVSGAGHEASAALARHLTPADWLHLHYRDKALLLARGVPLIELFLSLLGKENSHSAGRQMSAHLSAPELNVLSMVGPVGNNALQAVGVAAAIKNRPGNPLVVCSLGDGTTQEGEFFEAVAEAVRNQLPVLFLIEDNQLAISTKTSQKTFFSLPSGKGSELFGVPVEFINGSDPITADTCFEKCVDSIRKTRGPVIAVLEVARLADHSNADDQCQYRDLDEIADAFTEYDPIANLKQQLFDEGMTPAELAHADRLASQEVAEAAKDAMAANDPQPIFTAKSELPQLLRTRAEYRGNNHSRKSTMREAMNAVMRARLEKDPRVFLYGQDIEDPKGDVFGVTRGLSRDYPDQVKNSPLSESTIVGTSIGRAIAGERPVAFIQFADFLPMAANQILSELGSMFWRTQGGWQCPVILMITCGGYRPGLGPFHAQTLETLALHTPGIDVCMPSSAADAAGLLNAAFDSPRPTMFFYPKSSLNSLDDATSTDVEAQFVPFGRARVIREGTDITFVTWGNPVVQCGQAAKTLSDAGYSAEILDLRSLSPWDEEAVFASVEKTRRLVVVHEDNITCGFGAEILARMAERSTVAPMMRRVARPDVYVPYHFESQLELLPSYRRILETAADMLDVDVTWERPILCESGLAVIQAMGSGPADDAVTLEAIHVRVDEMVEPGQLVAEIETTKSIIEVVSTVAGRIDEILVTEGETVRVGQTLMTVQTSEGDSGHNPATREDPGIPHLKPRITVSKKRPSSHLSKNRNIQWTESDKAHTANATIVGLSGVTGGRLVTNDELLKHHAGRTSDDIYARTGIESRFWAEKNETSLSLGVDACRVLIERTGFDLDRLTLAIACTTTPTQITPSLACRVLAALSPQRSDACVAAYDINAACSGYLYALQTAWDHLQHQPDGYVLLVTSEVLSRLLDIHDFSSAFLFGDAATATLIAGPATEPLPRSAGHGKMSFERPVLSGRAEDGSVLSVPLMDQGCIKLKGEAVYDEAVRSMIRVQTEACVAAGIPLESLTQIIPHQANGRILKAIEYLTGRSVFNHMRNLGNTSSSSIPLALRAFLKTAPSGDRVGLCSFGGGFTYAAAVAEVD